MDHVLSYALVDGIHDYLDTVDTLVANADARSCAALAETELVHMTAAWRALLRRHQSDENGRCAHCSGWLRKQPFPCSVWTTARDYFIAARGHSTGHRTGHGKVAPGRHAA